MSKKEWGNATWFLFHTLAEKLKPQYGYEAPRLLHHIFNISYNLPCPDCSEHAKRNIRSVDASAVVNKATLKKFLWQLHNKVNRQLRKPQLAYRICDWKYKQARTLNIVRYFSRVFDRPYRPSRLMLRARNNGHAKAIFLNYLNRNLYKFYP